jgi:glycosyltransferase involved in cell wall biosynthesis
MKIAFLTPEYPHQKTGNAGGIGTSIKNLAKALSQRGHHVRVLVYGQKYDALFWDEEIAVQQIKNIKIKGLSWWLTRKKLEEIINTLYQNQEIDLVEVPDWTGISSFIQPKKCPIVVKLHGSDTYFCHLDQRKVKTWNKFHEKRALKNASGYLAVSHFVAATTNQIFQLQLPFEIIPNGIDTTKFLPESNMASKTVLYFGTLIRKKGVLELPILFNRIVAKVPQAKLLLIGKDASDIQTNATSTWQLMQPLFTDKALEQTTYLGPISYEEMNSYIAEAPVCVFPSFAEAFPVSWLEAMAKEKAIVASNIGWAPEMITHRKEGILEHPQNHEAFAEAVVTLLENSELNLTFGKQARRKVETQFSNEVIASQHELYYQKIIATC